MATRPGQGAALRRAAAPAVLSGALALLLAAAAPPQERPTAAVELPGLRSELVQMMGQDQVERTGQGLPPGAEIPFNRDYDRVQRLKQIVAEHGWPTHAQVGERGGTAAWVVAQHGDFDVAFQRRALRLMGRAAADGQADATEVAYLEDRVRVNSGTPQRFGTQVRCRAGRPEPATPLASADHVEGLRHRAGMEPLDDYYDTLAMMCADEQAAGLETGP